MSNIITAGNGALEAEIVVVGSGPGGAITAALLAEAGRNVLLVEDGPYMRLDSAPHFSQQEMMQKYRNGGITVGMGNANVSYVEGRCVGGGSEINRGLYHRTPADVLERWSTEFGIQALLYPDLEPHFDACEETVRVSYLPGEAPLLSRKLDIGAQKLGWNAVEVPRLVRYDGANRAHGTKQSMTETFVPRFFDAGGTLLSNTRIRALTRPGRSWSLRGEYRPDLAVHRDVTIRAGTVFLACGAIQTPALLRRSGIKRNVGNTLHFHPMIKVVAQFPEEVNPPDALDPVHQIKEFDPQFSLGCSMSSPSALALAMTDHSVFLHEVDRNWKHMAIYYAQATGGVGTVRSIPGFRDPLVRVRFTPHELSDVRDGLVSLCRCLFAAGADVLYPSISNSPPLESPADLRHIADLPAHRANLQTLHLFSTCPMGQTESRCVADSFGKVHGTDHLYIADASLLPAPTIVNPQGTVMAVAHRNVLRFLEQSRPAVRAEPQRTRVPTNVPMYVPSVSSRKS